MTQQDLSQEEIFANDENPLDAILKIRQEEARSGESGVNEESLDELEEEAQNKRQEDDDTEDDDTDELDDDVKTLQENDDEDPADSSNKAKKGEEENQRKADDEGEEGDEEKKPEGDEEKNENSPKVRKYKANGQDFEFTEQEIFDRFGEVFGKAMDYTQKLQKISPYRKMISAIEEEGIKEDQLNLAIDALKGNKDAIVQLMKSNDIDPLDIDPDVESSDYQPRSYGKSDFESSVQEITSRISADPEYPQTVDVIKNQWDDASRQAFAKNPEYIAGLHGDIKSGFFQKVSAEAAKMKVLDGNSKSDIEYYMLAGQKVEEQENSAKSTVNANNQKTQAAVENSEQASSEARRKRAAGNTRSRADKGVIDYLDDDDENFEEWYKDLMSKN